MQHLGLDRTVAKADATRQDGAVQTQTLDLGVVRAADLPQPFQLLVEVPTDADQARGFLPGIAMLAQPGHVRHRAVVMLG